MVKGAWESVGFRDSLAQGTQPQNDFGSVAGSSRRLTTLLVPVGKRRTHIADLNVMLVSASGAVVVLRLR